MKPSDIREILRDLGTSPKKGLGQHFLVDQSVLHAILDAADIRNGETVLEIGPGLGVLTDALLRQGATVIAIEQDKKFAAFLEHRFLGQPFRVVQGDAAHLDWLPFVGSSPWKFISNLPYGITSLALRKALWNKRPPERVVVLIQRDVAERAMDSLRGASGKYKAKPKTNLLSLMLALSSLSARIVRRVPAKCFYPAPKVVSAVFEIIPMPLGERTEKWGIDPEKIMEVAKVGFAHPRKVLASNLSREKDLTKAIVEQFLEEVGVNPKARAEDLSAEEWAALVKRFVVGGSSLLVQGQPRVRLDDENHQPITKNYQPIKNTGRGVR